MNDISKREDVYLKNFLTFYFGSEEVIIEPIREEADTKTPDYFISNKNVLIEVKEVHDRESNEQLAQWSIVIKKLQNAIDQSPKLREIRGTYLIDTPPVFKTPTDKERFNEAASKILESVINLNKDVSVFNNSFKINKVSDEGNYISFAAMGQGGSYDAANIMHQNVYSKVNTANQQLRYPKIQVTKKILLFINKITLLTWQWDIFKALSYMYSDLLQYNNIDEIWFQQPNPDGTFSHMLLYRRAFFQEYESGNIEHYDKQDLELFAQWFSALSEIGNHQKAKLFKALTDLLKNHKPDEIFSDPNNRIEIVRFGRWLAENNQRADANWLVQQFLNDPDPLDPPTDDKSNYGNELHQSVIDAIKPELHAIHTVKGHLAWTVQLLALKKDFLKEAYDYTQKVLRKTKHLYLVLQWIYPLIEVSNRRFWLKELDGKQYKDFKKLSFELLNNYGKYPDIAKSLVHLFNYLRELTTSEAKVVLDKLDKADDYEALLLYFAIYRKRHFNDEKYDVEIREFDSSYAFNKLEKTIKSDNKELLNLRSGIAWNIWKILSEDEKEFETLSPLIDDFLTTSYDNHLYHNFEMIVEEYIDKRTKKALEWFKAIIKSANEYIKLNKDNGRHVWLGTQTDKVLNEIAKREPKNLIEVVESLSEMWMNGAFIGTIDEVFNSYKFIKDSEYKEEVKQKFKVIYSKMKAVHEKIQQVNWD